jgi:hypothetical protein
MSGRISSKLLSFLLGAILLPAAVWSADRPNLTGAWQLNPSKCDHHVTRYAGLTWVIDQKDAAIHVSEIARRADGKETRTDFSCTTDGKECPVSTKDQPGKVSFWYNGPVLVEMEFRGRNRDTVIKKSMKRSGDGKLMQVEITPLIGDEQAGKMVFEKQ